MGIVRKDKGADACSAQTRQQGRTATLYVSPLFAEWIYWRAPRAATVRA